MLIFGGRRAIHGHFWPPFSSCLASASFYGERDMNIYSFTLTPAQGRYSLTTLMKLLGQPSSVWRLVRHLWNLYVKYSLDYPKADFVGRFSISTMTHCHTGQPLWLKLRTNAGSATPSIAFLLESSMSLSCSQAQTKTKPTSQAKAWWRVRFLLGCLIFI